MQFQGNSLDNPDVIVHNCRRAMTAALNRESSRQERGLNLLATIGSSAPYIGLLGTVYGIMNSFIAIGGAQSASISSVAPGIAEALIATANRPARGDTVRAVVQLLRRPLRKPHR